MTRIIVSWAGDGNSTLELATKFHSTIAEFSEEHSLHSCDELLSENEVFNTENTTRTILKNSILIIFISTSEGGTPPRKGKLFYKHIQELALRSQNPSEILKKFSYVVVGIGDSQFGYETFCTPALDLDFWLQKLGAKPLCKVITIDRKYENLENLENVKFRLILNALTAGDSDLTADLQNSSGDIEDFGDESSLMLSDLQRTNLIKEGYKIVGTHSAVKLCRWTKSHLRGRGGCYKHTFYGITSSRCMEMTPSLACANKCVFCWRHHTNPVSKEWKWAVDEPELIVDGASSQHIKMIAELKGVAGVKGDRFENAQKIRHCALSLVGEPIMYPYINELINILHSMNISTFLVTNAQFPEALKNLRRVTQLYLSVDAFDRDSLKKIDRPLFSDFWERFEESIKILSSRPERTVFRLTLVKQYNMNDDRQDLLNLASLIRIGRPSFIELKGVTYSGVNSGISMSNVPWHVQVVEFAELLFDADEWIGKNYSLSCQHSHSCSVLIASNDFYFNGKWHTWIDYPKFHELANTGGSFTPLDYCAETPDWALFDSEEKGFDPEDTRWYRPSRDTNASKPKTKIECSS